MELFDDIPEKLVIHHSASNAGDHTWKDIKSWHLAKGWDDIGYHYGITSKETQSEKEAQLEQTVLSFFFKYSPFAEDTDLYPVNFSLKLGRDTSYQGAHAKGFNHNTLGIVFEGNFDRDRIDLTQLILGAALCSYLLKDIRTDPAYIDEHLTCHRDLPYPTQCPGRLFPMSILWGLVNDCLGNYYISDHNLTLIEV